MDELRFDAVERRAGWVISCLIVALVLIEVVRSQFYDAMQSRPLWWLGLWVVGLSVLGLALGGGWRLAPRTLRTLWRSFCAVFLVILATYPFFTAAEHIATRPWWAAFLLPLVAMFTVIAWSFGRALIWVVCLAAAYPVGALLAGHEVETRFVLSALANAQNVAFPTLFWAVLVHLERRWRETRSGTVRHLARLRRLAYRRYRQVLTGAVHDDVLGALTAAGRNPDRVSDHTARQATSALGLLRRGPETASAAESCSMQVVVEELRHQVARWAPGVVVRHAAPRSIGSVPIVAAAQLSAAVGEALRNAVAHAGPEARITLRITEDVGLVVAVEDDGGGFVADQLAPARLGVRTSIVERMASVAGGWAEVTSAPGAGTSVRLGWSAPERSTSQDTTPQPAPQPSSRHVPPPVVRLVIVVVWLLGVAQAAFLWEDFVAPGRVVVALAVSLAVGLFVTGANVWNGRCRWGAWCTTLGVLIATWAVMSQYDQIPPSSATWSLRFTMYCGAMLWLLGHRTASFAGFATLVGLLAGWAQAHGFGPGAVLEVGYQPIVVMFFCVCWDQILRWQDRRAGSRLLREHAARVPALIQRSARGRGMVDLSRIRRQAERSLRRVSQGGQLSREERRTILLDEAAVRDLLRSPALAREPLAASVRTARARGVEVLLLDDSQDGRSFVPDAVIDDLTAVLRDETVTRVVIRIAPPPESDEGTCLVERGGVTERIAFRCQSPARDAPL